VLPDKEPIDEDDNEDQQPFLEPVCVVGGLKMSFFSFLRIAAGSSEWLGL
jgi:hypothetical protein